MEVILVDLTDVEHNFHCQQKMHQVGLCLRSQSAFDMLSLLNLVQCLTKMVNLGFDINDSATVV